MIFTAKKIRLKNGKTAILKSPAVENAAEMLGYIRAASGETDFLVRYPEEYDVSIEREEKWLNNSLRSPNSLMILCLVDGKIVGNCNVEFRSGIKTRHRALIGIAILRNYWNLGIGSAMFRELISVAMERGVEILELEFIEGNDRARRLYEKFGFQVVSEKPNAIKLKDGTILKEFYMQKVIYNKGVQL